MTPHYSFFCEKCKLDQEEMFSMSSCPDFITCPECGGPAQKQITGGQGFLLKGTCWERDRYTGSNNLKWRKTEE